MYKETIRVATPMLKYMDGSLHRRLMGSPRGANTKILDVIPAEVGPRKTSFRGGAVYSIRPPGTHDFHSMGHFAAVMLAPSPRISAAFASDKLQTFDAPKGMLVINPANVESRVSWSFPRENIAIAICPHSLLELAEQEFVTGSTDLRPVSFGKLDFTALSLARMLRTELMSGDDANELYVDSVITLFSIHLLRNYSDNRKQPPQVKGGLSALHARRVREFLEENVASKISVAELAAVCSLSPGYFLQAFTRTFGEPPYKYLLNLRLDMAEQLLCETEIAISEVADLSGFSSQSHLTSTLRRYRNITPAQLRTNLGGPGGRAID